MEQSVKERIIIFIKKKGISQKKFETLAKLSNGYLNNLKHSPTVDKLHSILNAFPELNRTWLLTGEGEMLNYEDDMPKQPDNSSPCFDLPTIQGGAGHGTGMEQITTSMVDQAAGRMMAPGLPTGEHIPYIQVRGDSMVNHKDPSKSIPDGAWVGVKASTLSAIQWGEVYAIMTTDGPIIKRIMQSDKEDCIRCVSFNEEDGFAPFDLPYTDIIPPLYNVLAVVSIKHWK